MERGEEKGGGGGEERKRIRKEAGHKFRMLVSAINISNFLLKKTIRNYRFQYILTVHFPQPPCIAYSPT